MTAKTAMPKKFHLAWFTNFVVDEWLAPFSATGGNPWDGEFYLDFAKSLERACFDYIMFEDKLTIYDTYGGSMAAGLKGGIQVPKHDPAPLAAVIGAQTSNIGVVATMSTLGYPPFLLARLATTIDHLAGGRFGWNIVTSAEDTAAQNFGLDKLYEHDLRYEMAEEYMEVVNQLFESWDPDAVVMDYENNTYADPNKVRTIDFEGKYYKCRGPLNTAPSPQGRPTYVQAGGSPRGRDFAAMHADSIIAGVQGNEGKRKFREDIRQRAVKFGRNPDDIKVLFLYSAVMGETEEDAQAKFKRYAADENFLHSKLALVSGFSDIDLAQFPLDKPLPEDLTTNGETASFARFAQLGSGKTLAEVIRDDVVDIVGTPEQVADHMATMMEEVGGDGFLIRDQMQSINRRTILEVTEGLVPVLQRRGLVRTEYTGNTLRETLKEF